MPPPRFGKPAAPKVQPKPAPKPAPAPAPAPVVQAPAPVPVVQAPVPVVQAPVPVVQAPAPAVQTGLVRVLSVGINYAGTPYELAGCINDATNLQAQVRTYFPSCIDYRLITDNTLEKPTRANILAAISWLVGGLQPGQNVLMHYAGHGGTVRDTNGDEVSGLDSCIYPINGRKLETILDDELRELLANRVPAGCKCFVLLDSCHSGSAVDLRYKWQAPSANSISYTEDTKYAKTAGNILFLSGCQDTQLAADTVGIDGRPCGAATMALLETWKRYGSAIKIKHLLWDVRAFLKEYGYSQIPDLTSGTFLDMNGVFDLGSAAI